MKEVVQLYIKPENAVVPVPLQSLQEFKRIAFKRGESRTVNFNVATAGFLMIDNSGKAVVEPGEYEN